MTSWFTVPMAAATPLAETYAAAAKKASKCGSKNFIWVPFYDDRMYMGAIGSKGKVDNVFLNLWPYTKYRWQWHDFRVWGLWGTIKRHYYFGELLRQKDERIFMGKDEIGNKYWYSRRAGQACSNRFVEPVDPHWFRGANAGGQPMAWQKWLYGISAHTPAALKARGESSRITHHSTKGALSFKWTPHSQMFHQGANRDPQMALNGTLLNPDMKTIEEAGFSRWFQLQSSVAGPVHPPFFGEHEFSDDLVEEYYRGQWAFCRSNKGNDHDEWKG